MKLRGIPVCACLSALACAGVLAWGAGAALADGGTDPAFPFSTVSVDASGPFVQGKPFHVLVTGFNDAPEAQSSALPYDLYVYLLAAKAGTCPTSQAAMTTLVQKFPTETQDIFKSPVPEVDAGSPTLYGLFAVPVFEAQAGSFTGRLYICAYSDYAVNQDAAWWSFGPIDIKPQAGGGTGSGSVAGGGSAGGHAGGGAQPAKPGATAPPQVTQAGDRLICSRGRWSGHPSSYSYSWVVTHERGAAGLSRSLRVTPGMRGREAECSVTATNSGGNTTSTSRPVTIA